MTEERRYILSTKMKFTAQIQLNVDAPAGVVLIPRGYHHPSSQHLCVELRYHEYVHNYKLTVNKTWNFRNT